MPDVHGLIEKLPHPKRGWTLPSVTGKYCGPLNDLETQLDANDNPNLGHEPTHELDSVCLWHDKMYRDFPEEKTRWDKEMLRRIDNLGPSSGWKESVARRLVKGVIWGKVKLGLGIRIGDGEGDVVVGGCLQVSADSDAEDEDNNRNKYTIILHAPSKEMGQLLNELGIQKIKT